MHPPSFDLFAPYYDATRTLDPAASRAAFQYIARRYPPRRFPQALELGIGTGRIAFPMTRVGFHVVGVDRSAGMLGRLLARPRDGAISRPQALRGDATRLPFRDGSFDVVYWVHVLHLVPRWKRALDEAVRVLRPNGVLLALRTEGGRDIREISNEYDRLTRRWGARRRTAGVRRIATVARYLRTRGLKLRPIAPHWDWEEAVSVRETLRFLDLRVYSSMRSVPLAIHRKAMRELRAWASRRFGDLSKPRPVHGDIRIHEAIKSEARRPGRSSIRRRGHHPPGPPPRDGRPGSTNRTRSSSPRGTP